MKLVLSLFTGAGLLDQAFREAGFCVVSAGDIIYGQDIRDFKTSAGSFTGIIGGSPCQDFSSLKRNKTPYSVEMLNEYIRIVKEASPEWWLLENVASVPDVKIEAYEVQRIDVNQGWYSDVSRLRHIQFGSKGGHVLNIPRGKMQKINYGCALATDDRAFSELLYLQGLDPDYDLPDFTVAGKKKMIGNGVPLVVGRILAKEVLRVTHRHDLSVTWQPSFNVTNQRGRSVTHRVNKTVTESGANSVTFCQCGCKRPLTGRKQYFDSTCRKRAQRRRGG